MKHKLTPAETAARRDMFAAAALTGLLANPALSTPNEHGTDAPLRYANQAIDDAVSIADCAIEVLDETNID